MNDPAKTSFSPFTTPIRIPWYVVALVAVPLGWFAITGFVNELLAEQTRWMTIRILAAIVLGPIIVSWIQRPKRKREGTPNESHVAATAARPPRDTRFDWLPWCIAFSVVWVVLSLIVHGVCRLIEFDFKANSVSETEMDMYTSLFTLYLFVFVESRFGGER